MADVHNGGYAGLVVDAVDDAVGAAPGAEPVVQWWHEPLSSLGLSTPAPMLERLCDRLRFAPVTGHPSEQGGDAYSVAP